MRASTGNYRQFNIGNIMIPLFIVIAIIMTMFGAIYNYNSQFATITELETWTDYNVDVKVTSSHYFLRHGADSQAALDCAQNNGTFKAISEKKTRRLHLFCLDDDGSEYVIIIKQIEKAKDAFSNATSELITAFKLEGMSANTYITSEVINKETSIIVRLVFKAGELFFMVP